MARKAIRERELKRVRLVEQYAARRAAQFAIINDPEASPQAKHAARIKIQKMPRNASPVRLRRRCVLTGRPRGNFRRFGLSRNMLRQMAMAGEIPGVRKSSW